MQSVQQGCRTIDAYIAGFPENVQQILTELRSVIRAAAPDADEEISYQIPTFTLNGNLAHFAAWKEHIGFYPTSSGMRAFRELSVYECTKGAVRFPMDKPLPMDLIRRIVEFRVAENLKKQRRKPPNGRDYQNVDG